MRWAQEDRVGFRIKAEDNRGWEDSDWGLSEGDPLIEEKMAKKLVKQASKLALKAVKIPGTVATITAMMGDAIGTPIGNLVRDVMEEIAVKDAEAQLNFANLWGSTWVDVELTGDFEREYRIEAGQDVKKLIPFLATVPAAFASEDEPYLMRKAVVEACYYLQIRYLRSLPKYAPGGGRLKLTIDIDI